MNELRLDVENIVMLVCEKFPKTEDNIYIFDNVIYYE